MAALSLAVLIVLIAGFSTLEYTDKNLAMEVRGKVETLTRVQIPGELAQLGNRVSKWGSFGGAQQTAAVSFFEAVSNLFDSVSSGFNNHHIRIVK